jgi:hypothetical protein
MKIAKFDASGGGQEAIHAEQGFLENQQYNVILTIYVLFTMIGLLFSKNLRLKSFRQF